MRVSISIKWTLSAVLLVIVVVCVYAFFTSSDAQKNVDNEVERIKRIQYTALDEIGSQTTRYISLPASSLLFDNDKSGLTNLLAPVVENHEGSDNSYYAIYSTIIAPNGRVWVAAVNSEYDSLELAGETFFDRSREDPAISEVSESWLKNDIAGKTLPGTEDVERKVTTKGESKNIHIRQYTQRIESKTDDGEREEQGYLIIGYSIDGLDAEIKTIQAQGEVRKSEALSRALMLAIIAVIIGLVVAGIQALLVTRNIKKLSKAASQIANGDLSVRSDVKSHDEIGQLGEQFNIMADQVQALMKETEQKAMLEKEVDIARSIQTTLLPPCGHAVCGPVQLNAYFQPASMCGGDFFSYNQLPDGSVLLTIGDVTGHGVPAAMITACAKSALDTLLNMTSAQGFNLPQIIASLNVAICQSAKREYFMTFLAMRISADGRMAEIVNAGHNFPLLIRGTEVKGLVSRGERLGDQMNSKYESIQAQLNKGDMLLFFTDGLPEYANSQNVEYGEKRLRKVIAPCASMDVDQAITYLWNDFAAFCGDAPQNDDITLMFARI